MLGEKRIVSVITARAGSKGIPGKNYRKLMNEPLFLWSVKASCLSKYVDVTAISSNCPECKKFYDEAKRSGSIPQDVVWIQRPEEYATALSKNEEALIHALEVLDGSFDVIVNLQPTSPCRNNSLIDRCLEAMDAGGHDSMLTGTKDTPFLWRKRKGIWEYTIDFNGCCNRKMRQEFEEEEFLYHDNGNIFMTNVDWLLQTKCRIGTMPGVFETEGLQNMQIDEEFDFVAIEMIAKAQNMESLV